MHENECIDADASGNVQNGVVSPFWSSSLIPDAAASVLQANPNVRLVVSLAGFSQFIDAQTTRNVDWYDPSDTNAWITNAVNSINSLAQQYSLSGIDIAYENFPQSASFTECIGGLITQLKNSNSNFVESIGPFGATLSIYQELFSNLLLPSITRTTRSMLTVSFTTQSNYVSRFKTVAASFDTSKMLMSVEARGRGLQGSDFI